MIKFPPFNFWVHFIEFHERIKTWFTVCNISALVLEIFKFKNCVKYANEMTDDIIHFTKYYVKYINWAILVNLQCRALKHGRLIVLQETPLQL